MNVSLSWLRQLVHLPEGIGWQEIGRRLTLTGLEVEAAQHPGAGLSGAVVVEVRGRRPHPRADRLTLVDVFDGKEVVQVVCGAPNVPAPGEPGASPRLVWARPGASLPSGITLGSKEVRGILSPGMLCAEDELGLSGDHAGILVLSPEDGLPVGADFAAAAGLPDTVLRLNVTPNRPDCLGHVGVAREVAALFATEGARLRLPAPDLGPFLDDLDEVPIDLREPAACLRYTARVLDGVRVLRSPLRTRLLLQRLGVRAISSVVDATNLAMLEWGQPLHAFDLHKVRGGVVLRRAGAGEVLRTLDGQERTLTDGDLVVADRERGLAIAGVMGGEDSEVTAGTTALLLESACFDPGWVRRTARRLKLHSEAAHRFERGVDPNDGLVAASARCAELILTLGGGRIGRRLCDAYPRPVAPRSLRLRTARTRALLGAEVDAAEQARLLGTVGLGVSHEVGDDSLQVAVPTFRPDLLREVDLVEEVGRLMGYDQIPARLPLLRLGAVSEPPAAGRIADRARDLCRALGLDEIHSFAFGPPERIRALGFPETDRRARPLRIENPLREELSALRTQLVAGLLDALRHNLSHGEGELRLFEVGEVFLPREDGAAPEERPRVAAVFTGHRDHWLKPGEGDELDFFDVRGVVEELLRGLGVMGLELRAARLGEAPWLHPGVSAVLVDGEGRVRGELGELHPALRGALGIDPRAFAFELDLPEREPAPPQARPLPRYPGVDRDLSFFIDAQVPAGEVLRALRGGGEALLASVRVLEDYREAGRVPAGRKGLLLSLTYRSPERTLTDAEVQAVHEQVVARLREHFPIDLR